MTEAKTWQEYKLPFGISVGVTALVWLFLFTLVMLDPSRHHTLDLFLGGQTGADTQVSANHNHTGMHLNIYRPCLGCGGLPCGDVLHT
jgi:hypothetical protein